MVREINTIKKIKKQLNKNLSCIIRTSSIRQTTQPSSPAWKRPIYLKFFVFRMQCGSFYSTMDNLFFQIASCKQLNSKEQSWKSKIHSIMSQFTTLNVRTILNVPDSATFCVLFSTFLLRDCAIIIYKEGGGGVLK